MPEFIFHITTGNHRNNLDLYKKKNKKKRIFLTKIDENGQNLQPFFEIERSPFWTSFLPVFRGRRGGLMVSALDSGSGGPGSSPGRGTALCSWARYFTLIVPLSTQVYKWVPANLLLGVTLRWTSIPSRGE